MPEPGSGIEDAEQVRPPEPELDAAIPSFILEAVRENPIEKISDVADREIVPGSEEYEASDIQYTQNGRTISVREEFPGDYLLNVFPKTLAELHGRRPQYGHAANRVSLDLVEGFSGDDFNIGVLHEVAGHAVDESSERKKAVDNIDWQSFYRYKLMDSLKAEPLSPEQVRETVAWYANSGNVLPDDRDRFSEALFQEYQSYAGLDPATRRFVVERIGSERQLLRARCTLSNEQNAWLQTLRGIHGLREKGVNLFGGTQDEFLQIVADGYNTYLDDFKPKPPQAAPPQPPSTTPKLALVRRALAILPRMRK